MSDPNAYYLDPIDAPVDSDPGLTVVGIVSADEAAALSDQAEVYYPEKDNEEAYIVLQVNDQASPDGYS
jgi:hypothetical protein